MPEQITILGDGAMATVCSILLTAGGHGVTMWGAFEESIERLMQDREQTRLLPGVSVPAAVRLTANDAAALDGTTMVLSAIPTQYMRSVWNRLKPLVPAGVPVVSVAKGIENGTLLRPTQIVADVLGGWTRNPLAALSGPNIAAEIAKYLPATAVAAADDPAIASRVQAAFSTQWFRVYTNNDATGVELAGATKNVIAIAAGILDGLAAGNNAKAALVTRGLVEITRLGEKIGKGQKLADILDKMDSVAEGVPTTKAVAELARRHKVEMPITEAVHSVLFGGKDAIHALTDLMTRDPKPEWEG
jgi:glycerol-3-phosphate dehydrogenase (NAD(P)+)